MLRETMHYPGACRGRFGDKPRPLSMNADSELMQVRLPRAERQLVNSCRSRLETSYCQMLQRH
jgi:hypothetical protein